MANIKIKDVGKNLANEIRQKLNICGQMVVRDAVKLAPKDKGQLRASWNIKRYGNSVKIKFASKYGYYVHEGTGIYASNGLGRKTPWTYCYNDGKGRKGYRASRYNGGKGRKEYRTTRGQKPQPFLSKSLEKNKDKIIQILTE